MTVTDIVPESYVQLPHRLWGFTDYQQGVVYFWADGAAELAEAMQEWVLQHRDRFASVKTMSVLSHHAFILYAPPAEAPLADKSTTDMDPFGVEETSGQGTMNVIHDV